MKKSYNIPFKLKITSRERLGLESPRTHLSQCVSFRHNTKLNIVVRGDSESIPTQVINKDIDNLSSFLHVSLLKFRCQIGPKYVNVWTIHLKLRHGCMWNMTFFLTWPEMYLILLYLGSPSHTLSLTFSFCMLSQAFSSPATGHIWHFLVWMTGYVAWISRNRFYFPVFCLPWLSRTQC